MKKQLVSFFGKAHPLVLLYFIVILVAILTYSIPAGQYDRVKDPVSGRMIVAAGTYHHIESTPATFSQFLLAVDKGLNKAAPIISFLLLIGGALGVIATTGSIEAALGKFVGKFKSGKSRVIILGGVMFFFLFCSSSFGMGQESMAFAPFVIMLMLSLGYDTMTGIGAIVLGYGIGYGVSVLNPFTIAIAQGIAGVPYPSGSLVRIIISLIMFVCALTYLNNYATNVKDDPTKSLSPDVPEEFRETKNLELVEMKAGHIRVWVVFFLSLAYLIYGAVAKGFYFSEISSIFLYMGILSGIVFGLKPNEIGRAFAQGARDMAVPCLIIGFALSINTLLDSANIIDSIIYYLSLPLRNLPPVISAGGMVLVQTLVNFFVNSGSTQAAITMPIMSPLASILGVNQQVAVLAFQLGDGLSNILWVTCGTLMIGLGIANINYFQWLKFIGKIYGILLAIGIISVMLAQYLNWGPF